MHYGAEIVDLNPPAGRFEPLDTENPDLTKIAELQQKIREHNLFCIVGADGDADRPFMVDQNGYLMGDEVVKLTAQFLQADAVVVPETCTPAMEDIFSTSVTRTDVGSPYVVVGMEDAVKRGAQRVVGGERNGGILIGSDITIDWRDGTKRTLKALPTRDAAIALLSLLKMSVDNKTTPLELSGTLDLSFRPTWSGLIKETPIETSVTAINNLMRDGKPDADIVFRLVGKPLAQQLNMNEDGFKTIRRYASSETLGLRIEFGNGLIIHFRSSRNAPEARVYSAAYSIEAAQKIITAGIDIFKRLLGEY